MSQLAKESEIFWPSATKIPYAHMKLIQWPDRPEETGAIDLGISDRITYAVSLLTSYITIDTEVRGGVPVLAGTRIPVSRLFAEVADGQSIEEIADDKEIEIEAIRQVFKGFAAYMARPFAK
jgi:uncharacterized protein (DUF433 family)